MGRPERVSDREIQRGELTPTPTTMIDKAKLLASTIELIVSWRSPSVTCPSATINLWVMSLGGWERVELTGRDNEIRAPQLCGLLFYSGYQHNQRTEEGKKTG
jgi:hypothetical protein